MAAWLKAAEDLLEVVDRRAKLVVSELSDEQSNSQPSASNGQHVQSTRIKSKEGQSRLSSIGTAQNIKPEPEEKSKQLSVSKVKAHEVDNYSCEFPSDDGNNQMGDLSTKLPLDNNTETVTSDIASSGVTQTEGGNDTNRALKVPVTETNIDTNPSIYHEITTVNSHDVLERSSSSPDVGKGIEIINGDHFSDGSPIVDLLDGDSSLTVDLGKPESETVERGAHASENESDLLLESSANIIKQLEPKVELTPMKVQEQLDEAQGLLQNATSTGQSKEARLARVCAGLSSRLQEYKFENAQLEELLVAEKVRCRSYEAHIKQLQQNLSASKSEVARVESTMSVALAAKNSEIEALVHSTDALKKQAADSEEKLASLQANMESVMRSRELTETRMMQALREELAAAERRAEEERAARSATEMAAVDREVDLERRVVEASNGLARMQRLSTESASRAMQAEHKVALLEVECATLNQELQDLEARVRRGQKKSSEEANLVIQMQAWQEEVERARQGQRDAEHKLSSSEAELQKMRVEMAGIKRDSEHYSRQEHMELEKRYRELTDLLYHKQTQLEAVTSEKAATEFQLEKEKRRFQEVQVEGEKSRAFRRASTLWEDDTDIKALEPLPLHHRHMVGASMQLERAAKLLDTGAVRATRFLWRYPVARVILLFYLVFVHLFLMYLLHHLQAQADDFVSRELAASMRFGNSSLP